MPPAVVQLGGVLHLIRSPKTRSVFVFGRICSWRGRGLGGFGQALTRRITQALSRVSATAGTGLLCFFRRARRTVSLTHSLTPFL